MAAKVIDLGPQSTVIRAACELCFEVVAAAGRTLRDVSDTEKIVEFRSSYRGREVVTVERVLLERPTRITYEWLKGPLAEVHETISFSYAGGNTTLTYAGWFLPRPGTLGRLTGRLVVKSAFERLVREHLEEAKDIAQRRAARSRVYPAEATGPDNQRR